MLASVLCTALLNKCSISPFKASSVSAATLLLCFLKNSFTALFVTYCAFSFTDMFVLG